MVDAIEYSAKCSSVTGKNSKTVLNYERYYFDPTLSFDNHVPVTVVSSCMSKLSLISHVKFFLQSELLKTIIDALVFSKFSFNIVL